MSKQPEYDVLQPVHPPEPGEFLFLNASVGFCGLCGNIACGMGGSNDIVCVRCAEVVMSGQAKGAIKWDEEA